MSSVEELESPTASCAPASGEPGAVQVPPTSVTVEAIEVMLGNWEDGFVVEEGSVEVGDEETCGAGGDESDESLEHTVLLDR